MGKKYIQIKDDVPFDLPICETEIEVTQDNKILKTFKTKAAHWNFKCCDCDLVHNIILIHKNKKVEVIMRRDNRATSQLRRHSNKKDEDFYIRGRNLK